MSRPETLREQIATIIQAGHIAKKTSDEIAGEVLTTVSIEYISATKPVPPPVRRPKPKNLP